MNYLRHSLIALAVFASLSLSAQDKFLTIEECFNPKMAPGGLRGVSWIPNSHKFTQVKGKALVSTDPYSKRQDTIMTQDRLIALVKAEGGELEGMPMITWKDEFTFWFTSKNQLWTYNTVEGTLVAKRRFGENPDALEVASKSLNIATVEAYNIQVHTAGGSRKITYDGEDGLTYGQSVHQNEFGISKGLFWSTEGHKLAFYRMDERRVTKVPLMDITTRPSHETKFRYPLAGDSSHTVTVGVYNTLTEETIYLKTEGPYDQYLTNITWSPDDQYIYIAWLNRDQNHMQLRRYRAQDGELDKILFEEKHEKYVEPEHGPIFLPESNTQFLWFSERDGFNHLYLYKDNKNLTPVTAGNWEVTDFLGFDKSGEGFYFEGTRESPLERQVYYIKVKEKDGKAKKITTGSGTHKVLLNTSAGLYMDILSSRKEPRKYTVYKLDGTLINEVYKAANPLEEYKLGEVKIEPILVDGVALYSRTFLPPDFSADKKYPVVVYVYGGPHAQMVTESWLGGGSLWMHYMAQNGYVVFTVDNRGSAARGLNFENATHRQLGTLEMQDQLAALAYLKRMPWVDSNRIGVHGWSFGGFMTTSLMTRKPGTFKVGVAGGPVIDWKFYEIMYTERYMDRPQDNKEGYDKANLLNYADKLEGRLLMIHGMDDNVVIWQHSLLYIKAMVKAMNANLDYFVYPGHKHNVVGPDRAHLYKKVCQYFFDYL
ncbi:MAG: DPP IV N-terminal domain-containing protein [Bacteroidetes bacterium]|nr:DPP IV N-terminal domain-containing protein [Bacteroidota bacterium]